MTASLAARSVDELYRRAIEEPETVDDGALREWMQEFAETLGRMDKSSMRTARRVVRDSRKLAAYWLALDAASLPDWRNGVDEALGARGWEPQLDIVAMELADRPSPGLFEEMKQRYRAVHFQPWLDGVTYEEWLEQRD